MNEEWIVKLNNEEYCKCKSSKECYDKLEQYVDDIFKAYDFSDCSFKVLECSEIKGVYESYNVFLYVDKKLIKEDAWEFYAI